MTLALVSFPGYSIVRITDCLLLSIKQTYYDFHIWFEVLDDSDHASKQPSPSHRNDYGIWLHPQVVHLLQYFQGGNALSCQDG